MPCLLCGSYSLTARAEFPSANAVMDGFGGADLTISRLLKRRWSWTPLSWSMPRMFSMTLVDKLAGLNLGSRPCCKNKMSWRVLPLCTSHMTLFHGVVDETKHFATNEIGISPGVLLRTAEANFEPMHYQSCKNSFLSWSGIFLFLPPNNLSPAVYVLLIVLYGFWHHELLCLD